MLRFLGVKDSENSVYIFFSVRVHVFQRPCTKICTYDIGSSTPGHDPVNSNPKFTTSCRDPPAKTSSIVIKSVIGTQNEVSTSGKYYGCDV